MGKKNERRNHGLFSVSNFVFGFHALNLKKLKIIQYDFLTGPREKMGGDQYRQKSVDGLELSV